jgi:hypothetical protein
MGSRLKMARDRGDTEIGRQYTSNRFREGDVQGLHDKRPRPPLRPVRSD